MNPWTQAHANKAQKRAKAAPPRPPNQLPAPTLPSTPIEALEVGKPTVKQKAVFAARSPVRWYCCPASDKGLLQVKTTGVPEEKLPELIAAITAVFPELQRY